MGKKYDEKQAKKDWVIDVRPIKSKEEMGLIIGTLRDNFKMGARNEMVWRLGVVSMLRISDLVSLKKADFLDDFGNLKLTVSLIERKTGKKREIYLKPVYPELASYIRTLDDDCPWLFPNEKMTNHIGAHSYYMVLKKVAELNNIKGLGTHSMRKSGAYTIYSQTGNLALVQKLLNHSSQAVTLRYLGLDLKEQQDVIDSVMFF